MEERAEDDEDVPIAVVVDVLVVIGKEVCA